MFAFLSRHVSQILFVLSVTAAATTSIGCASAPLTVEGDTNSTPSRELSSDAKFVRVQLAARRKVQLERLHAYAANGVFPKNRVSQMPLNVFRDEDGHLCAVANLVDLDGKHALVDQTAKTNNFVRVAEQSSGDLHDWVLTSGFTKEEIARIQAPYMPMEPTAAWQEKEKERLQAHFADVERELLANQDASLDLAVARLQHPAV